MQDGEFSLFVENNRTATYQETSEYDLISPFTYHLYHLCQFFQTQLFRHSFSVTLVVLVRPQ